MEGLIGPIDRGGDIGAIADRIVAATKGDPAAALAGTPLGTQEMLAALSAITGQQGRDVGDRVTAAIQGGRDALWTGLEDGWNRRMESPVAAMELAADAGQRNIGRLLLTGLQPLTLAAVRHLPLISTGVTTIAAAYGVKRLVQATAGIGRGTAAASAAASAAAGGARRVRVPEGGRPRRFPVLKGLPGKALAKAAGRALPGLGWLPRPLRRSRLSGQAIKMCSHGRLGVWVARPQARKWGRWRVLHWGRSARLAAE